jgi:hypothetical protein
LERVESSGFFASLMTPAGIAILAVLFLANLLAAYEIAVFRDRPVSLVCGLSVILPVVGPILFLTLPPGEEELTQAAEAAPATEAAEAGPQAKKTGPAPASSLSVAAAEKKARPDASQVETAVFKRGDTTFNRRFFETKFPGFFRVVPGETEKDLVLVVRSVKYEYVAKRISRISSNEMHVQVLRGGTEVAIPFGEITEVQVKHKDAKN